MTVVIPIWICNVSNSTNVSPNSTVHIYWIFLLAERVTGSSSTILEFVMAKNNSSGLTLSNKATLNSCVSDIIIYDSYAI